VKRRPLEGVRVVDLTMMWAGPYATKLLAEMGAEVLKIESPSAWDNIRTLIAQPGIADPWNSSYYFNTYNRQKKSVTIDLAQERGREVFLRLLGHCDVLIENYRADVLDNLGLSTDVLRAARPDLVVVSMAGFGKTGADRGLVGFGPVIEMMSGLTSLTGYVDDDMPYKCGVSYGDPVAGQAAAGAVVMGLLRRRRTGEGVFVDLAQREVASTMAGERFVAAAHGEDVPVHRGNRDPRVAPRGCYRCADVDDAAAGREGTLAGVKTSAEQWLVLSVLTEDQWPALAALIGRDDLAGLDLDARRERHDELDGLLSAWCATRRAADAVAQLRRAGVPAAQVLDTVTVHDDAHLNARGFWLTLPHPRMDPRWKQPGAPWRFAGVDTRPSSPAPLFGQHTRAVLGELVGLDDAALDALAAAGVIADAPINPGVG
jgi:crotonobetainyl-CoA:carnitine CoA-transferase CaiB-like acyl-CoA transferase